MEGSLKTKLLLTGVKKDPVSKIFGKLLKHLFQFRSNVQKQNLLTLYSPKYIKYILIDGGCYDPQ